MATQPLPSLAGRPGARAARLSDRAFAALHGLLARLAERDRQARARHRLGELDDRLLRDIGLTRAEATHEARRRFWD